MTTDFRSLFKFPSYKIITLIVRPVFYSQIDSQLAIPNLKLPLTCTCTKCCYLLGINTLELEVCDVQFDPFAVEAHEVVPTVGVEGVEAGPGGGVEGTALVGCCTVEVVSTVC